MIQIWFKFDFGWIWCWTATGIFNIIVMKSQLYERNVHFCRAVSVYLLFSSLVFIQKLNNSYNNQKKIRKGTLLPNCLIPFIPSWLTSHLCHSISEHSHPHLTSTYIQPFGGGCPTPRSLHLPSQPRINPRVRCHADDTRPLFSRACLFSNLGQLFFFLLGEPRL